MNDRPADVPRSGAADGRPADDASAADPARIADDNGEDEREAQDAEREPGDGKPPVWRRRGFWLVALPLLLLLIVGAVLYWLNARQFVSTDDAYIDAHIVRVSPQVQGQLVWVADADNQHVKAGQLLARVAPDRPQAQLAEVQSGVAAADAALAQAQRQVEAAQAQARQALANVEVPVAEAQKAAADLARYRRLRAIDPAAVAPAELDAARAQLETAQARAAAARRAAAAAGSQVQVARTGITAARAQRRSAQARVSQAQVTLGDLAIRAPIAGQLVNRSVNIGSTVGPQSQLMAIIPDRMWVTANFKETQLRNMRAGQPVDIRVDAFPDVKFHGHVASIQHGAGQAFALLPAQNASGNFVKVVQRVPVRILFDRADGGADPARYPIGPGMSVTPTVKVR